MSRTSPGHSQHNPHGTRSAQSARTHPQTEQNQSGRTTNRANPVPDTANTIRTEPDPLNPHARAHRMSRTSPGHGPQATHGTKSAQSARTHPQTEQNQSQHTTGWAEPTARHRRRSTGWAKPTPGRPSDTAPRPLLPNLQHDTTHARSIRPIYAAPAQNPISAPPSTGRHVPVM